DIPATTASRRYRELRCLAVWARLMFRFAAVRWRGDVLRIGRTTLRPPLGPRLVVAARSPEPPLRILSSSAISIPWRLAAATIFRRADSLALADSNSVWFHLAIALRTCDSSFIGKCPSPFLST